MAFCRPQTFEPGKGDLRPFLGAWRYSEQESVEYIGDWAETVHYPRMVTELRRHTGEQFLIRRNEDGSVVLEADDNRVTFKIEIIGRLKDRRVVAIGTSAEAEGRLLMFLDADNKRLLIERTSAPPMTFVLLE